MTRAEIAEELMTLVLEIGNGVGNVTDDPVVVARRAYIRGLASHAILKLRDRLLDVGDGTSMRALADDNAPSDEVRRPRIRRDD